MKYTTTTDLTAFEFWSGAKDNAKLLTLEELQQIDNILENEIYFETEATDTQINDLFWFDFGFICDLIGLNYNEETGEIDR